MLIPSARSMPSKYEAAGHRRPLRRCRGPARYRPPRRCQGDDQGDARIRPSGFPPGGAAGPAWQSRGPVPARPTGRSLPRPHPTHPARAPRRSAIPSANPRSIRPVRTATHGVEHHRDEGRRDRRTSVGSAPPHRARRPAWSPRRWWCRKPARCCHQTSRPPGSRRPRREPDAPAIPPTGYRTGTHRMSVPRLVPVAVETSAATAKAATAYAASTERRLPRPPAPAHRRSHWLEPPSPRTPAKSHAMTMVSTSG